MAKTKYQFKAVGFYEPSKKFAFSIEWKDGEITGDDLAIDMLRAFAAGSFFVSEGNMTYSGEEGLIRNGRGCKLAVMTLFFGVMISEERLPPVPKVPKGAVA